MKKSIKTMMSFIVLLNLIAIKLGAQLAGTYTINSAVATGGNNFQSFSAFAAVVNTAGISAPVTVIVAPGSGPYVEQVSFLQITGASAANTITIDGNFNTLTFAGTLAAPHTLVLNGADYMTFNNLNVTGTGASYALVVHLWGQANNNRFFNCVMTAPPLGTLTGMIPFSLSGSGTSGTASGNSGSNNVVETCTMTGGYYSTVFAGATSSPFNTGNMVINSSVRDFYLYGIYNLYCQGTVARGNTVERVNRTNASTAYGIYFSTGSVANGLIEKNRIQRLFDANQGMSNSAYCIYIGASATAGNENIVRNNVISNINYSNGLIYAIYAPGYNYLNVYHNTVSIDDPNSTAGTTYGIFTSGSTAINVRNNIVNITRGGTGTKYCLYYSNAGVVSNNNGLYNSAPSGVNGIGYFLAGYTTMANWQAANNSQWDQASVNADPQFANPATFNYLPASVPMNNIGTQLGITTDIMGVTRYTVSPDPGAYEYYNTPCAATPGSNTVISPTIVICPNNLSSLTLANNYTVNGITYQWATATNSVGPFVPVSGGTLSSITTPTLANSIWYNVTIGCANGGSTITAAPGQIMIATTVTNSVPYYEDFEGITAPNKLPNCSWAANNLGVTCQTNIGPNTQNRFPNSGDKYATFYYTPANTNYFYTNGIQLYAGVTYSASMWFTTESYGYNTYDLSIMVGPNQSTTGLVPIVNLPYAFSGFYKQLSNTFTVATSGIYYVAIKAISNGACCGYYLSWDDLSVTIPCDLNPVSLGLTGTTASSICAGQAVNLTATGANTYTWNTGAVSPSISDMPISNTSYIATGTNSMTGCMGTIVKNVAVYPTPPVSVFMFNPNVCEGHAVTLNGVGASTYTWSTGDNGAVTTVTPASSTTYTLIGANQYGCQAIATQFVNVYPLPNVTAASSVPVSCQGDAVTLTGSNAVTYQWASSNLYVMGTQVVVMPYVSTTYTVTGTDANGCSNSTTISQSVFICTSVREHSALNGLSVYPNPTSGSFHIALANGLSKTIEVTDISGRTIITLNGSEDLMEVNIAQLAGGIYYVKVKSNDAAEVIKIVKQ